MGPATRQEERGDAEVAPPQRPVLRPLGSQCRLSLRRVSSNLYYTPLYGSPCQSLPNDQHDDTSTAFQRHRCLSTCIVRGGTAIRLERGEFPFTTRATHTHTHKRGGGEACPSLTSGGREGLQARQQAAQARGVDWVFGIGHHPPRPALRAGALPAASLSPFPCPMCHAPHCPMRWIADGGVRKARHFAQKQQIRNNLLSKVALTSTPTAKP
jgi:hypothetical protein